MKGAVLILVVCAGLAQPSFFDVLSELPTGISNMFGDAWRSFKAIVNKPVRIKRLGSGARRKAEHTPTTTEATTSWSPTTEEPVMAEPTEEPAHSRLVLPVFKRPEWGWRDHWSRKMQQPIIRYMTTAKDRAEVRLPATTAGAVQVEELFFVKNK